MHGRFVGAPIETGLGVVDAIASQYHLTLDQKRRSATLGEQVAAQRHLTTEGGVERTRIVIDHADFQRRCAAENVLGARRVLHAGQLHDDAIGALLLHNRFGDAEFVDTVAQDGDVLLYRAVLDACLRLLVQARGEAEFTGRITGGVGEIGKCAADFRVCLGALGGVAENAPPHSALRGQCRRTGFFSRAASSGYR